MSGVKHDQGKRPWHLLPWDAVEHIDGVDLTELLEDDENRHELVHVTVRSLGAWFQGGDIGQLRSALLCVLRALELDVADEDTEHKYIDEYGDALFLLGFSQVVDVLQFGAQKYAERNWEKGIAYSRVFAAAVRHIYARHLENERNDPETGLNHLAHAACEILFALTYEVRGRTDLDDRPGVAQEEEEPAEEPGRYESIKPADVPHVAYLGLTSESQKLYLSSADVPWYASKANAHVYPSKAAAEAACDRRSASRDGTSRAFYGVEPAEKPAEEQHRKVWRVEFAPGTMPGRSFLCRDGRYYGGYGSGPTPPADFETRAAAEDALQEHPTYAELGVVVEVTL